MNIAEMDERYLKAALEAGIAQGYESFARLRSGGERAVALTLIEDHVRHQYEKDMTLSFPLPPRWGRSSRSRAKWKKISTRIVIPDFYLPDYNAVIEYWGVDENFTGEQTIDPERYKTDARRKGALYHNNNIPHLWVYSKDVMNGHHVNKIRRFVSGLQKR